MIYKLITWIEIYFVSLQLPSGGVKVYSTYGRGDFLDLFVEEIS